MVQANQLQNIVNIKKYAIGRAATERGGLSKLEKLWKRIQCKKSYRLLP